MIYTVYYCWDDQGRPLYIGCTGRKLSVRIGEHRRYSDWFQWVAHVTSQAVAVADKKFDWLYAGDEHKLLITASTLENDEIERLAPVFNLYRQPDRYAALRYRNERQADALPTERRTA